MSEIGGGVGHGHFETTKESGPTDVLLEGIFPLFPLLFDVQSAG
jgi:hypothetical protein